MIEGGIEIVGLALPKEHAAIGNCGFHCRKANFTDFFFLFLAASRVPGGGARLLAAGVSIPNLDIGVFLLTANLLEVRIFAAALYPEATSLIALSVAGNHRPGVSGFRICGGIRGGSTTFVSNAR